jgi:hypothetical protein
MNNLQFEYRFLYTHSTITDSNYLNTARHDFTFCMVCIYQKRFHTKFVGMVNVL